MDKQETKDNDVTEESGGVKQPSTDILSTQDLPAIDDQLYAMMTGENNPNSNPKWSVDHMVMAVTYYGVLGSYKKTAKHMAASGYVVPWTTIAAWKNQSQWWPILIKRVRAAKQDELDALTTDIVHASAEAVKDRIEHGDFRLIGDKLKRVPVSARDLSIVGGTWHDKRALIRGEPTSRTESGNVMDTLNQLAKHFEKLADQGRKERTIEAKKVETEYTVEP